MHACMQRCMMYIKQNLSENIPVTQWHLKKRYMPLEQRMPNSGLCKTALMEHYHQQTLTGL